LDGEARPGKLSQNLRVPVVAESFQDVRIQAGEHLGEAKFQGAVRHMGISPRKDGLLKDLAGRGAENVGLTAVPLYPEDAAQWNWRDKRRRGRATHPKG
jgi:hypothetical protein